MSVVVMEVMYFCGGGEPRLLFVLVSLSLARSKSVSLAPAFVGLVPERTVRDRLLLRVVVGFLR